MIQLPCPWCGPRNVSEFRYAGEGGARPDPETTTAQQWRRYLYMHRNPLGWTKENWYHGSGCRKYFSLERHTETHEVRAPDSRTGDTPLTENAGPPRGREHRSEERARSGPPGERSDRGVGETAR